MHLLASYHLARPDRVLHTRQQVLRSASAGLPELVATPLLGRSSSSKQQTPQSSWLPSKASAPEQRSQEDTAAGTQGAQSNRPVDQQLVSADHAANATSSGVFEMNASKPDLLAQIQAIKRQESSPAPDAGSNASASAEQDQACTASVAQQCHDTASGQRVCIHVSVWVIYDACLPHCMTQQGIRFQHHDIAISGPVAK